MNIAEWLDNIDPRAFYFQNVFDDIPDGFTVDIIKDEKNGSFAVIQHDERSQQIYLSTWDDEFRSLKARGLPFFVLDEDYEGEPEVHGIYSVIPYDEELIRQIGLLGAGYITKTAENVEKLSLNGGSIYRAIAVLVCGEAPGDAMMGRGFAASANLRAVQKALGLAVA